MRELHDRVLPSIAKVLCRPAEDCSVLFDAVPGVKSSLRQLTCPTGIVENTRKGPTRPPALRSAHGWPWVPSNPWLRPAWLGWVGVTARNGGFPARRRAARNGATDGPDLAVCLQVARRSRHHRHGPRSTPLSGTSDHPRGLVSNPVDRVPRGSTTSLSLARRTRRAWLTVPFV